MLFFLNVKSQILLWLWRGFFLSDPCTPNLLHLPQSTLTPPISSILAQPTPVCWQYTILHSDSFPPFFCTCLALAPPPSESLSPSIFPLLSPLFHVSISLILSCQTTFSVTWSGLPSNTVLSLLTSFSLSLPPPPRSLSLLMPAIFHNTYWWKEESLPELSYAVSLG